MAVLTIDSKETSFFYLDSGPLKSNNYVTLFLLHGHTFHSPIFKRLFEFSPWYNVRIVAVTRRDYTGSSLFLPAELDIIKHGDTKVKTGFLQERAREIATFIDKFIQQNSLPKSSSDGSQGGIALLGWSLGNVQALSVVGLAQHMPVDLVSRLEPYFRGLILYECPYHSLGFPPPQKSYHPLRDPSIPKEEQNARFNIWVSGYFKHDGLSSRDVSGLEYITPSSHRRPTITALSPEELASVADTEPGPRSEDPFFVGSDPNMMSAVRKEVFFPSKNIWPKLKVISIWGKETTWSILYASWELERYVQEAARRSQGQWQRPFTVVSVEGANHFAHWDDSEKLMRVFGDVLFS